MTAMDQHAGARIERAVRRARGGVRPTLVSVSLPIGSPHDVLALIDRADDEHRFFWQRPTDGIAIAALGAAAVCTATGTRRFVDMAAACDGLLRGALIDGDRAHAGGGPIFVGGFAFDAEPQANEAWAGFPTGRLVLPRVSVMERGQSATLTFNVLVDRHSEPDHVAQQLLADFARLHAPIRANGAYDGASPRDEATAPRSCWQEAVAATLADIEAGRLEKLVLARTCSIESAQAFDCAHVVRRLRHAYPGCTTFWIGTPEKSFVGATPERLVQLEGDVVRTVAMAGTSGRGTSHASDQALGQALRHSRKDRHEHALVVRAMAAALAPLCADLEVPAEPNLVQLDTVHHLVTPIAGTLRRPMRILELVDRLHPSPAVAGWPREAALARLREREGFDRGWYAGPVGWMNAQHQGEFAVALRSALVRGGRASLFAGAGIVAGSDPDAELAETRLKLQPLLSALTEI